MAAECTVATSRWSAGARVQEGGIRAQRFTAQLDELATLYQQGMLHVTIRSRYPLDRIADTHHDVERGHGRGKVVIVID